MMPPLPIMPSNAGQPRPTGVLASNSNLQVGGVADGLSQALTNFVTSYQAASKMKKDEAAAKFEQGLKHMSLGIPVDKEVLMKHAKKAGIDWLPTEPTPQANVNTAVATQPQIPGVPQGPDPAMTSMLAQAGSFANPRTQSAAPSLQSPMGQWLGQFEQAGKEGGGIVGQMTRAAKGEVRKSGMEEFNDTLTRMSGEQKMELIGMMRQAFEGGPNAKQATEMLTKAGLFKATEEGLDSFVQAARMVFPNLPKEQADMKAGQLYLNAKMGTDQVQLAKLKLTQDLMKNFDNQLDKSAAYVEGIFSGQPTGLQPHMSPEEMKTYMDAKGTLYDAHPTAPTNLVDAVAHAQLIGDQKLVDSLMKTLNSYPRKGTIDYKKHQETLGYEYANLGERAKNNVDQLNLGIFTELGKQNNVAFDNWNKIREDKNASPEQKKAATEALVSSMAKDSKIKIKYGGQDFSLGAGDVEAVTQWSPSLFHPLGEETYPQLKKTPDAILAPFLGADAVDGKVTAIKEYAAKAAKMPDGKERLQALGTIAEALKSVPKSVRLSLIQSLDIPTDMKPAVQQLISDLPTSIQLGSGKLK